MFLHKLHLNPRSKEARRDLADPYQLHSTLCRAFSEPEQPCSENAFMWRLEPESSPEGHPRVLIQSRELPQWERIGTSGWFARDPDPSVDLVSRLGLDDLKAGSRFRFRLRTNPCVTRMGKRHGLTRVEDQEAWILRKGQVQHGFELPILPDFNLDASEGQRLDIRISQEQFLRGRQRTGQEIRIFSVLYDGHLTVKDPEQFRKALECGIGHGKALGLGLLSVIPLG